MKDIVVFTHSDCLLKDNGPNHPERKDRLDAVLKSIKEISDISSDIKVAPFAEVDDVCLVHPKKYISNMFSLIPNYGLMGVEKEPYADTFLCPNIKNAILRSCGAGIAAANTLIEDNKIRIFCAIRPPGHHACFDRSMGFCVFKKAKILALCDKNSQRYLNLLYAPPPTPGNCDFTQFYQKKRKCLNEKPN